VSRAVTLLRAVGVTVRAIGGASTWGNDGAFLAVPVSRWMLFLLRLFA
jgi:hypothetical protein